MGVGHTFKSNLHTNLSRSQLLAASCCSTGTRLSGCLRGLWLYPANLERRRHPRPIAVSKNNLILHALASHTHARSHYSSSPKPPQSCFEKIGNWLVCEFFCVPSTPSTDRWWCQAMWSFSMLSSPRSAAPDAACCGGSEPALKTLGMPSSFDVAGPKNVSSEGPNHCENTQVYSG